MKKKDFCQECGKYMCKKKLRKSQVDKRLLCVDCYKKENKERNGFGIQEEEIIPKLNNSTPIKKKAVRKAKKKQNCNYIFKGEGSFLKDKYGNKYFKQLDKLKYHLGNKRMEDVLKIRSAKDKEKREKEIYNQVINDFKQFKEIDFR